MSENVKVVSVTNEELKVRVAPATALKTAWKTSLLQGVSFVASFGLLVLGYLQTVNIASVLTPTQALIWIMVINILQLALRAWGVKPIVLDKDNMETR